MSIAFLNTDLQREFAKHAICKVSFFVFAKSEILTSDNITIYQIAYFGNSDFAFSLKLHLQNFSCIF